MRTFHYNLHVIDQPIDDAQGLGNGRLRLLERESIEPPQDRFDLIFAKEFLCIFLCHALSRR